MAKKYPFRSKRKMTYHGRSGYPKIHKSKSGKEYIMTRKKGGGTKRLHLEKGRIPKRHRRK